MFKRVLLFVFVVSCLFSVNSCKEENEEPLFLNVKNITLEDKGRIPYTFGFDLEKLDEGKKKCTVRTRLIFKNDTIKDITAFTLGNKLSIDIISYPFDFNSDDSCFTVHDVGFELYNIKNGTYDVCVRINNSEIKEFLYDVE